MDPTSSFLAFIEPVEDIIIKFTNKYGKAMKQNTWKDVDKIEFRAYLGLLLLSGVFRSRHEKLSELWDDQDGRPIFRATMSLQRFETIHNHLRFDDKDDRSQRKERDKLAAIRVVYEKWLQQVKMMYVPGQNLTVDEQLIPFRGKCNFRQYIPTKPHKYGIKVWVVCDSDTAYAYNLQVYVGKNRNAKPEVGQGQRVVLELTEGLPGRNITCDNFFTSYSLAQELKRRIQTVVGTIRKNKKEIPPILLDMKKKPEGHAEFVFDSNLPASMVSYVTKRNKFVTCLSTYHLKKEMDGTKPAIITFYNGTKAGVDRLDQLVGEYSCNRKSNRWPMKIFGNIIDVVI